MLCATWKHWSKFSSMLKHVIVLLRWDDTCNKRGNFENGKKLTSITAHCKLAMLKKKSSKYCRSRLMPMMTLYSISSTGILKFSSTDTILHSHTSAHANIQQEKEASFLIPDCIQKFLAHKHGQQLQNSICRPWTTVVCKQRLFSGNA